MVLRRFGIMTVTGLAFIAIPTAISNNIINQSTMDTVIVAGYGLGAFTIWNGIGFIKDLMSVEDNEEDYDELYVMDETEYNEALYNTAKVVKNSISRKYQERETVIRDYYEKKLADKPVTNNTTVTKNITNNNNTTNNVNSFTPEQLETLTHIANSVNNTKLLKG